MACRRPSSSTGAGGFAPGTSARSRTTSSGRTSSGCSRSRRDEEATRRRHRARPHGAPQRRRAGARARGVRVPGPRGRRRAPLRRLPEPLGGRLSLGDGASDARDRPRAARGRREPGGGGPVLRRSVRRVDPPLATTARVQPPRVVRAARGRRRRPGDRGRARPAVGEAAAVLTELDSLRPAPPTPSPPPGRVRDSRSAWRHPAALATGAMLLLAFGIAIGAGIVRYTEPDRPAGTPTAASTPLTPPPARITGGSGTLGARRAVTPEILQGMLQAARASLFEGRYGEAIAAYQAVLKRDPKNVDALTHLGLIVAIGGHADTALETLDRALAINPTYPPALLYRGQVLYESKKDTAEAIRSWEKFLAVAPPGEDRARVEKLIADAKARP